MKRCAGSILVGLTGMLLSGCPIYSNQIECYDNFDCPDGHYCSDSGMCLMPPVDTGGSGGSSGSLPRQPCNDSDDCGSNETCGEDGTCHTGDCYFSGCVEGQTCVLDGYRYICVPVGAGGSDGGPGDAGGSSGSAGQDGGPGGSSGSAGEAAAPTHCGNPGDCSPGQVCSDDGECVDGSCQEHGCVNGYVCDTGDAGMPSCVPENPAGCINDDDCSGMGAGYKCLSGICTAPADQCTDKTQCPEPAIQSCVDGKCIASCSNFADCPDGYTCDAALGVCASPTTDCSVTQDCGDPTMVCVDGACVEKCGPNDTCPGGYVCVANGCVPDQKPAFTCGQEGVQDVCSAGSICLHHSCYIACTPNPDSCAVNPPDLNQCKSVATLTSTYNVCGSSTNLGDECDPTVGSDCGAGKICVDGFCR